MKGTFIEKLLYLMQEKNITRAKLCEDLKFGVNQVRMWEKGAHFPTARTVQMIADYFGVTADSLTDPEKEIVYTYVAKDAYADFEFLPLSDQEKEILSAYRSMTAKEQMRLIQSIMNICDGEVQEK
jgi:transcriptional regulator with XRE-family HTH domain